MVRKYTWALITCPCLLSGLPGRLFIKALFINVAGDFGGELELFCSEEATAVLKITSLIATNSSSVKCWDASKARDVHSFTWPFHEANCTISMELWHCKKAHKYRTYREVPTLAFSVPTEAPTRSRIEPEPLFFFRVDTFAVWLRATATHKNNHH